MLPVEWWVANLLNVVEPGATQCVAGYMIWHFFDNRTGQHCEAADLCAVTATNGACLRSTTPP